MLVRRGRGEGGKEEKKGKTKIEKELSVTLSVCNDVIDPLFVDLSLWVGELLCNSVRSKTGKELSYRVRCYPIRRYYNCCRRFLV